MVDDMRDQASNLEDWVNGDSFEEDLLRDFPRAAAVYKQSGMDRRSFLKFMGASLVAAGLQGCVTATAPNEEIIPYVRTPEEVIPGNPVHFATSMMVGGLATGLVIETHEGRPHRIEGNPLHPASLGGSDVMTQASILELYNPDRSTTLLNERVVSTDLDFRNALRRALVPFGTNGGEGLRILTETITSPTLARQMAALLAEYPNAVWHQYEPLSMDNVLAGAMMAFGEMVNTVYQFANANVVLTLDADFMTGMPGHLRYARDFMSGRMVRQGSQSMNRLYAVESTPSNTGLVADHRLALQAREVEVFARALAAALGADVNAPSVDLWDAAWFDAVVADLEANAGSSIVVAGPGQPPAVHAVAHAINAALGNVGSTVVYTPPLAADPTMQGESLNTLVQDMTDGNVEALIMLGGNPVYNAPAGVDFAAAMDEVAFTMHLSMYNDETSVQATWHVPQTHYIEEWSDGLAYDGTASIVQPPIGPLYDSVYSAHQILALLLNDDRAPYDIVRETWQEQAGGDFEGFWRRALHDGVVPESAPQQTSPALVGNLQGAIGPLPTRGDTLEVIFRPDPALYDGRFAYNAWLQELPNPLTRISWDNAALISPDTAAELGIRSQDLIELTVDGNTMQVSAWVLPGHPDGSITVYLGYGRGISAELDRGLEFNAYDIRPANAWFASGVEVATTGLTYNLARSLGDVESNEVEAVLGVTFAELMANPAAIDELKDKKEASLLEPYEYDDNAWGMTIDQTLCMGCNACVIACQTENSIPTVGKEAIEAGREMYWIRVDLYHSEIAGGQPATSFQPVPCMHCENAPCEQVCPVQATVHSSEGLNQMIYNRCVGTRYCSANCPYGVRRFNFEDYIDDDLILIELRNPDVTVRAEGVMEKCTYCVQRINAARIEAKKVDRPIADGEIVTACQAACPTQAIVFGNINDPNAQVTQLKEQAQNYSLLGELNTEPRTTYLARVTNPNDALNGSEGA